MLFQVQEEQGSHLGNRNEEGSEEWGFPGFLGPNSQAGLHLVISVFVHDMGVGGGPVGGRVDEGQWA